MAHVKVSKGVEQPIHAAFDYHPGAFDFTETRITALAGLQPARLALQLVPARRPPEAVIREPTRLALRVIGLRKWRRNSRLE